MHLSKNARPEETVDSVTLTTKFLKRKHIQKMQMPKEYEQNVVINNSMLQHINTELQVFLP